ncbi:UbiX family flavin prenyltransferase [Candidatus Formimonas warabiya]|uniref:Flavin prenyltransferase UbiX n=1 Tax=Formimonas warabiya TaxID=1761012 RepID=A0A3G1KXN7_FORW1|nr:UbiX family flavin prenyltransferase [Candidatus Formimonas warabiya]ATW27202.1 hypothetical protein DCMF_22795 [Candidatus Formimonas warabiya]
MKIVVGLSGASGAIYGIRMLEACKALSIETHLVVSAWAEVTIKQETEYSLDQVYGLANYVYPNQDMGAAISSGSFRHDGMVIIPASMKTVAALAHGFTDNLIHRAADVTMKEKRKLILVPRETPLHVIHLRNLLTLAEVGTAIIPPMPALYQKPVTVGEIVDHLVARVLDQLGVEHNMIHRWTGIPNAPSLGPRGED